MITDATLQSVSNATDQTVVIEIYSPDETPTADGFDPANALKRYAAIAGLTFAGETYTQLIRSMGSSRRTTTESANTFNFELDNLSREASQFEFATGFEGCVVIQRLISRELSTAIDESIILFAGRCDKPTTGSKASLPVTAKSIIDSTEAELPRRKFQSTDANGLTPDNVLFEGFPYMPQTGSFTYLAREPKGGLAGLFGMKRTVTKTMSYSSFSDLDAEKYVPVVLGRCQIAGIHMGYADHGGTILSTTAFCEGQIESLSNFRVDDLRFRFSSPGPEASVRVGELGNVGAQVPHIDPRLHPNGYFSRTALTFVEYIGTNILETDAAPLLYCKCMGMLMTIPDAAGEWVTTGVWSDNPAAHARFILTSDDYYKLDVNWLDDESFTESYNYNNGYLLDASYADIVLLPNTANFTGGDSEKGRFLLTTGLASPQYFEYLNGDKTADEAFLLTPYAAGFTTNVPGTAASPGNYAPPDDEAEVPGPLDPPDPPGPGGTTNFNFYVRRRYTSNIVITDQIKLVDFLHKVLFVGSRSFLTQGPNGRLKLKNKKPVDWGMATAAITTTAVALDDVSAWIGDLHGFALLDPHTTNSELRTVTAAVYPAAQNDSTVTATPDCTVVDFAGCDGASTPATATITVDTVTSLVPITVTLDGVEFTFRPGPSDTTITAAGFIAATINAHHETGRRFTAVWVPGEDELTLTAKYGNLTLSSAPEMTHAAPLANPSVAPTLTETASGNLPAGVYRVGYTDVNARGETLMGPAEDITIVANKKITVGAMTLTGVSRNWFVSTTVNASRMRLHSNRDGSSFVIDLADLPVLTDQLPPNVNRTGCEVMRVETAFTDREESRTTLTASNVLKATFKWKLGNREKTINAIDLKYRDATQDFRLINFRLRNDAHIAKTKKINSQEVNGQSIDNHNQAYRIAAGILSEQRDADFFYEWSSDKSAVLLEEGDVVAITDDGAETYNLPVRIESIEYSEEKGFVTARFTARLYSTTLYDDSVAERQIPVIIQTDQELNYA